MPHICPDEIMAFMLALPVLGQCIKCVILKLKRKAVR